MHEMPITPEKYVESIDDFYDSQGILEEVEKEAHWSGLSSEAIERISEGTAPLMFVRDVDLMPVEADYTIFLYELEQKRKDETDRKRERIWLFI